MKTIFLNAFFRSRGAILGWGLSLGILGAYMTQFYDVLVEQKDTIEKLISSYPKELMAFFGADEALRMFEPASYLNVEFFSYMSIIVGIFALQAGSGLVVADEENGTLDLLLSNPLNRAAIFIGRALAFVASTAAILFLTWAGFALAEPSTTLNIGPLGLALPFFSLFGVLVFFGALSTLLSLLLPSRRAASMTGGLILVGSFFLTTLARMDNRLRDAADFSPLNYYQGGMAIEGMNWKWFGGLLLFSLVFFALAYWRFERRDLRVGGEGGWSVPGWRFGKLARLPQRIHLPRKTGADSGHG